MANGNAVIWDSNNKSSNMLINAKDPSIATSLGSNTAYSTRSSVKANTAIPTTGITALEFKITAVTQNWCVGLCDTKYTTIDPVVPGGGSADSVALYPSTGPGSQYPQAVYISNATLFYGKAGYASNVGDIISVVTRDNYVWFSTAQMRRMTNSIWNGSPLADPIKDVGGFNISSITTPRYPFFNESEGGGSCQINGGSLPFSQFLQDYINSNPSVLPLSGTTIVINPPPGGNTSNILGWCVLA